LKADFRHAGLASTGQYCMNAAFMSLERRERGIHVVNGGRAQSAG
jgi:hypothetical protein